MVKVKCLYCHEYTSIGTTHKSGPTLESVIHLQLWGSKAPSQSWRGTACPLLGLILEFKWIARLKYFVLQSHHRDYTFQQTCHLFFSFDLILLFQTSWGEFLQELTYLMPFTSSQTCICLMANLIYSISSNLTLFLTVIFHAMHGYAITYMHTICFILLFHSATIMQLHYVLILICLSQTVLIDLVQTCTYSMIVFKSQGIDWHPQSDSLGVSPSKWTQ